MIPAGEDIERFEVKSDVAWVLVIEKEVTRCPSSSSTAVDAIFSRHPGGLSDFVPIAVHQVPGFTWVWADRHGKAYLSLWDSAHFALQGKGYPDIATRQLVKTLSDNLPDK